ncbi:MAG: YitT family protein [Candidatus Planktophila sp.]|jgi:hypothetical protein|nr:YitT family protein [Candidatus Planktophila sp.]
MSFNAFAKFLRPHKTVPITPWTASGRWDLAPKRTMILFVGLFIFGIGDAFVIQGNVGNAPWSVLAQGVSRNLNISMGWSTFAISVLVLLAWIPLRERLGFGTISNAVIIAIAIQVGVEIIPLQDSPFLGVGFALFGIALVGVGTGLYITCGLGPGPRDGLMTAIHHRSGVRVGRVRLVIELSVVILGAVLGGNVGVGTLLFALFIGQSVAIALGVVARLTQK